MGELATELGSGPIAGLPGTEVLDEGRYGGVVHRTVLDNGLRIITESVPQLRSAAFGVYVGIGSRDENPVLAGASHFLEHLLFKGTEKRTAWDISAQIEEVGGETNAYTTKEYTCFYGRVLDRDLPLAIDVITDMLANSVLDAGEMDIERGVVLEEISMHADEPDDAVHDLFAGALLGDHPLARPVLGTIRSISEMRRDALFEFYRRRYCPGAMVVSAAGNLDHAAVVDQVATAFDVLETEITIPVQRGDTVAIGSGQRAFHRKETDQVHVVLGGAGIDRFDKRRYSLEVLNQVLGGGMSSRLFQEIRERRGLAYSVYSFASQFADAGIVGVYAGCAPQRLGEVMSVVNQELEKVASHGITEAELARSIGMITGGTVLGLEDSGARMGRLGKGQLLYGDFVAVDELLGRISGVTVAQVQQIAADLLSGPMSIGAIGPVSESELV